MTIISSISTLNTASTTAYAGFNIISNGTNWFTY